MSFLAGVRAAQQRMPGSAAEEESQRPIVQVPLRAVTNALLATSERADRQAATVIQNGLSSYAQSDTAQSQDVGAFERAVKVLEKDEKDLSQLVQERLRILENVKVHTVALNQELAELTAVASADKPTYLQTKLAEGGKVFSSLAADRAKKR